MPLFNKTASIFNGLRVWPRFGGMSFPRGASRFFVLLAGIMALAAAVAQAADQNWRTDGTSGTWTGANWSATPTTTGGTAWTSGNNAIFTANSTATFATTSVGNVTTSAGLTVTITAGGTATFASPSIFDIGSGSTLTWQSQTITATSAGGITKNSAGTLDLGALTYTTTMNGGFTLNAGTIIVSGNKALGNGVLTINGGTIQSSSTRAFTPTSLTIGGDFAFSGTGNANWDAATTIALGATTRTISNNTTSGSRQLRGLISGSSGAGLTFSGSGGAQIYIGNAGNTFTGPIAINGAEVVFNDNGTFGSTPSITLDGGRLTMATMDTSGNTTALPAATINSGINLFLGATAGTSISIQSGTGMTTYNGVIADKSGSTGTLVKQGAGRLSLGGASTYSGGTSNNNGTIQLTTGNNRLPIGTVLNLGQGGSANLGTLDLNGFSQQVAGLVSVTGINTTTAKNTVTNSSTTPATFTIGGSGTYAYSDGTTNNSGTIVGPVNLVMNGAGTQTLGDTNNYSGYTIISAGTLALGANASITNTTGMTLAAGATLDVSALASGFTFKGANPVQVLTNSSNSGVATINGAAILASGVPAAFHAIGGGSPTAGKISVTGNLTLNNNTITVIIDSGTLGAGTYRLLDSAGSLSGSANSTPVIAGGGAIVSGATYSIVTTAGSAGHVDLVVVAGGLLGSSVAVASSFASRTNGYLNSVTFTATVTPSAATGNVVFLTNGVPMSTNALSSGVANSTSIASLPRGSNGVAVQYLGDVTYLASTGSLVGGEIVTNHPPVAANLVSSRTSGLATWKIAVSNLLTNVTDIDGDTIALTSVSTSTNGITPAISGSYVLYSNAAAVTDQFTYNVSDGFGGTASALVSISVVPAASGQPQSVAVSGSAATVNFAGVPGYSYSVQRSTNLLNWTTIWTTNPVAGVFKYTDTFTDLGGMIPASAYYRLGWNP